MVLRGEQRWGSYHRGVTETRHSATSFRGPGKFSYETLCRTLWKSLWIKRREREMNYKGKVWCTTPSGSFGHKRSRLLGLWG